jgi:hypothetical protein
MSVSVIRQPRTARHYRRSRGALVEYASLFHPTKQIRSVKRNGLELVLLHGREADFAAGDEGKL